MSILVLNAGSSTLKFALFAEQTCEELGRGLVDWRGTADTARLTLQSPHGDFEDDSAEITGYQEAVRRILETLCASGLDDAIHVVGHRIVHGGDQFQQPTRLDEQSLRQLEAVSPLAPLHNPVALEAVQAARSALPEAMHSASFDTAYFSALPESASIYPVPWSWRKDYGIRRFGFHGISHAWCAMRAAELLQQAGQPWFRLVICHLGNGCSATAVQGVRPVATSMGFTPLEGLMMGTRSGSIDPGVLLYLQQQQGFTGEQLSDALNHESGLLGVSGVSSDFRQVEQAADEGSQRARLAIIMFADRIRSTIASLVVTMGGFDGLVFTAGIGEHSDRLRGLVASGLECLGVQLDDDRNRAGQADSQISADGSPVRVLIVRTREEQMIAREAQQLLGQAGEA